MQKINGIAIAGSSGTETVKEASMSDSTYEVETSGLQYKQAAAKIILPDGTRPFPLGSGLISGILGEGGAAVLYEVKNPELGFHRAVKLLRPNHTKESLSRFLKEFKICAQLNHPNIPVVHTVGQWHGLPYIEMEKITGFSLLEMITKFAPVPIGLVTGIGISICKALDYIHHCKYEIDKKNFKGFLHLDLKPSNIMLSDTGLLKIMDFGMATPLLEARQGLHPDSSIGSSQYIAPEILFGTSLPDVRSDLFSLGCILFELATGTRVFSGSTVNEIIGIRKNHSIPSLKKIDKGIPDSLIKLIERCLSFEKNLRPDSALSVRHQLEKIHKSQTIVTADDVVSLYISRRKANLPFNLPSAQNPTSMIMLYLSGVVGAICVGFLAFSILMRQDEFQHMRDATIGKVPFLAPLIRVSNSNSDNNESVSKTTSKTSTASIATTTDSVSTENSDFYESNVSSTQTSLMDSLRQKWTNRQFDDLRDFINRLPHDLATNKEVLLYKLRSIGRSGDELGIALNANPLNDGEYFFHKARYLSGKSKYKEALQCLDKAESIPSEFIDKRVLGTEVQLYRSRNLTLLFRENPTSENLKNAMSSWDKLLTILQDRPTSVQAREADREKKNLMSEASWRGIN